MDALKAAIKLHIENLHIENLRWRNDFAAQLTAEEQGFFNVAAFPLSLSVSHFSRADDERSAEWELIFRQRLPADNAESAAALALDQCYTVMLSFIVSPQLSERWHVREVNNKTPMEAGARQELIFSSSVVLSITGIFPRGLTTAGNNL